MNVSTAPKTYAARRVDYSRGSTNTAVSSQWFARPHDERFLDLASLKAHVQRRHDKSEENVVDVAKLEIKAPAIKKKATLADTDILHVGGFANGDDVAPSHWAFGQLASLAGAPAKYLRDQLPSQIAADAIQWGLRRNRTVDSVKTYHSPTDGLLHAITGPQYGRIPDWEVVAAIETVAYNNGNWKVPGVMDWGSGIYDPHVPVTKETTTLFASDRDVFAFLVDDTHPIEVGTLENGDPDLMFRGFYVHQSEMGSAALVIAGMYLRAICCNRILWGVEHFSEMRMIHTSQAPSRFIGEAVPSLESFASGSVDTFIEGVEEAKGIICAKNDEDALDFLRGRGLSKTQASSALDLVESIDGHKARSVWDMAQGITAVARDIPNNDTRMGMEKIAGTMLDKVAA